MATVVFAAVCFGASTGCYNLQVFVVKGNELGEGQQSQYTLPWLLRTN